MKAGRRFEKRLAESCQKSKLIVLVVDNSILDELKITRVNILSITLNYTWNTSWYCLCYCRKSDCWKLKHTEQKMRNCLLRVLVTNIRNS